MAIEVGLLKSIPYFLGLSTAELEAIRKHVFEQAVEKNDMILMEGDPANAVYFVVSGAVKVFKTSVEGKEQILCILKQGESFNDVAVFDGGPNPASAIAMTPVLLYGMNKTDMEAILKEYPNLADNGI